jgi:hypothetical protein
VEYEMVRAARANGHRVTTLGGPPSIRREWAPAHTGLGSGSFLVDGDTRLSSITNIHNMADKRNISASYNTRDYMCLGCNNPHSIADLIKSRTRVCISVTDHAFPPYVGICREEGGALSPSGWRMGGWTS